MRLNVLNGALNDGPRDGAGRRPAAAFGQRAARELERDLRREVEGEVRFDDGSRALYSTDASNYRQIPVGVVVPRSVEDVVRAVAVCHRHGAPITSRGGGTGLAGQTCNIAVILDHSKYLNRVLGVDAAARTARVEPGCVLDTLNVPLKRDYHLAYGPDPATHSHCTLGGMIGNNSCGVHSVMAGRTADNVLELDVLTHDGVRMRVGPTSESALAVHAAEPGRTGEIYRGLSSLRDRYAEAVRARFPRIPRRVSGYNLDDLLPERGCNVAASLVGTEGTCVVVLGATVRLIEWPRARSLLVLGYPDVFTAGDHVARIMEAGPVGLEGIDRQLIEFMHRKGMHPSEVSLLPAGGGFLLVEFGGDSKREADDKARVLMDALRREPGPPNMRLYDDPVEECKLWVVRESGLGATAFIPGYPDAWPGWEDAAVPPGKVGPYLREFRRLLTKYGYIASLYGHFGQGCIHCRISFDLKSKTGIDSYRAFIEEASDLVVSFGGTPSGEHGDGQAKAAFLEKTYGAELVGAFREFKSLWDPDWLMNPGKVLDAYGPTQNLRLGVDYRPRQARTHFAFTQDGGSFAHATTRCVGVGNCRRNADAFMCPTYQATMEEEHSTRGRARLLFEMSRADFLTRGWRDPAVMEALDLCIGCKGCKRECPVHVDMATYKSEYLAHHYHRRLRPRSHYTMGLIGVWARLGGAAPGIANSLAGAPGLSRATKWAAGIAPERSLPRFAPETFTAWFRGRAPRADRDGAGARPAGHGGPVLLYPDVFNDFFFPETLRAAATALEMLGYAVRIPERRPPEARPAIHYGMLRRAKRQLRRAVEVLRPYVAAGMPVICCEPSAVSVFRDEAPELLPQDEDVKRLHGAAVLFTEFLDRENLPLPRSPARAVVHAHCHEKAVLESDALRRVLHAMGVRTEEPEPGCCGMAGSFGFEAEHYELSKRIGERALLPAARGADARTVLIASGFSCRTQIEQGTGRRPLHPAEFIAEAMARAGGERGARPAPESPGRREPPRRPGIEAEERTARERLEEPRWPRSHHGRT
jgi:FAD/FMN-containing dehydrogenase/Fe-S oxidoreductase